MVPRGRVDSSAAQGEPDGAWCSVSGAHLQASIKKKGIAFKNGRDKGGRREETQAGSVRDVVELPSGLASGMIPCGWLPYM